MTEFLFYHLTKRSVTDALSVLLNKTIERGKKAKIQCENEEAVTFLDKSLWNFERNVFLPHGTKNTPFPDKQPVYLSADHADPAGADFLFLSGDVQAPENITNYERVIFIFADQDENGKSAARAAYAQYKKAGENVTYHPDV